MYVISRRFNPNHKPGGDEHGGEFSASTGTAVESARSNKPQVGKPFLVFRIGSPDGSSLANKNGGNAEGIADHLIRMDQPGDIAPATTIHMFEVTAEAFGGYTAMHNGHKDEGEDSQGAYVGKLIFDKGNGYTFSFGKSGYTEKHLGSFPIQDVRDKFGATFDDESTAGIAAAVRAVAEEKLGRRVTHKSAARYAISRKFNPNHVASGEHGGEFTSGASTGTSVYFEVAPDPNDKDLTSRWNSLSDELKLEISKQVAQDIAPDALKVLDTTGTIEDQVGGYLGATNPSLALEIADASKSVDAAKLLGYALRQDSMMVVSANEAAGLDKVGAVVVHLPAGEQDIGSLSKMYDKLYHIVGDDGSPLVGGFTASHGRMAILNFSDTPDAKLAELVDKQLGGKYSVHTDEVHSAFVDNKDYLDASHSEAGGRAATVWRESADRLRTEAAHALEKRLAKRNKADEGYGGVKPAPGCKYRVTYRYNEHHFGPGPKGGQFAPVDAFGERNAGIQPGDVDAKGEVIVQDITGRKYPLQVQFMGSLAQHLVRQEDGTYVLDPVRQQLHDQIIDKFLDGVPVTAKKEMFMTGGGTAAGKSTMLKAAGADIGFPRTFEPASSVEDEETKATREKVLAEGGPQAVLINPDAVKNQIPEYQAMVQARDINAAAFSHEESSMLAKRLQAAAIATGRSIVWDTTGDSDYERLESQINAFKSAGYKVNAFYASNPVDLALELAHKRGQRTGRYVLPTIIKQIHANVSRVLPKAVGRGLFDHVRLYDTTLKGQARLVLEGTNKGHKVKDKGLYDAFLAKGDAPEVQVPKADKSVKTADPHIPTNDVERMVCAVLLGAPKPKFTSSYESDLWDSIVRELADLPEEAIVDIGNEMPDLNYDAFYGKPYIAQKSSGAGDVTSQWVTIRRTNDEKQIVYGEVYAPLALDTYGEFMTVEDIEVMAHRFMLLDLRTVIDTQHDEVPNGSYPVESFIAREGDPDYVAGSWVLGVKVPDPNVWQKVKNGELNGFSFQCLVKPTSVDVEYATIRDHVGETELHADHEHVLFVQLDEIGNVLGGRTAKAADGHFHEISRASVTDRTAGHSHRFFL
jgi:hypothetical protein